MLSSLDGDCDEYTHVWEPECWETESRDEIREAVEFWRNVGRALELMNRVKEDKEKFLGSRIRSLEEELRVAHARVEELEPGFR